MATPSIADASWMFGMRDQEEEYQLQMNMHHHQLHQSPAENSSMATSAAPSTQKKKKRTHPDPDAQVIALSPKTLMAKNRFICEVCKKGFQREQNLQLHRRGHNLPWKLKQKSTKEVRKKVYLCPEPTCVHHHPSRALGDLTGIKKHFSRKHGEKKWKCDKCSKTYAVQSDWKAHSKTCGTKEYRCDCGTLFSRRDSFVTHQAFCDALAQENPTNMDAMTSQLFNPSRVLANQLSPHHLGLHFHESNFLAGHTGDGFRSFGSLLPPPLSGSAFPPAQTFASGSPNYHEEDQHPHSPTKFSVKWLMQQLPEHQIPRQHSDHIFFSNTAKKINCGEMGGSSAGFFSSDHNFMGDQISPVYSSAAPLQNLNPNNASASPHLSATALLQKAAQADSSCSINGSSSLLRSLGSSLSSSKQDLHASLGATSFGALLGDLGGGGSRTSRLFGGLEKDISGYNDNYQDNPNTCISEYATNEETKLRFGKFLEDEYSMVNIAGSDRLTRDFMGVGQVVGHMSGGGQHQKGHQASS